MMRCFMGLHSGQGGRTIPWHKQRLVVFVFLAIMVTIYRPFVAWAADARSSETAKEIPAKVEQSAGYAGPIISLDEVLNPSSSMEGDYPVKVYGTRPMFVHGFYWMDDHRVILNDINKNENDAAIINIWNVNSGKISLYGSGSVDCYADGMIRKTIRKTVVGTSQVTTKIRQRGPLWHEIDEKIFDKRPRVYGNKFECGEPQSDFVTRYAEGHFDEIILPLREEHGFLVTAKKTLLPDGRTKHLVEHNEIVLHRPGKEPKFIPIPSKDLFVAAYYPFVSKYVLYNSATGWSDIHLLSPDGTIRTIKPPAGVPAGGYPVLSRRGLLWLKGSVLPELNNGIYLSREEQIKRISSENVHGGRISPDGCNIAYTTTSVDYLGKVTKPTLKVMRLCDGEK